MLRPSYEAHLTALHIRYQGQMHIGIDFLRLFKTFGLLKHLLTTLGTFNGFLAIKGFQLGDYFLLMFNFLC